MAAGTGSRQSPREVARKLRRMGAYYAADRDHSSARKNELGHGQHHTRRLEANLLDDGRVDTLVVVRATSGFTRARTIKWPRSPYLSINQYQRRRCTSRRRSSDRLYRHRHLPHRRRLHRRELAYRGQPDTAAATPAPSASDVCRGKNVVRIDNYVRWLRRVTLAVAIIMIGWGL